MEKIKLITGNGLEAKIYEVGEEPIMTIEGEYVPFHGFKIMSDDEARLLARKLLQHGKKKN